MNEYVERGIDFAWPSAIKPAYDVVIIGGGGHGIATAYYLATRHGITNVAVIERSHIGAGNSGRNTTIIRANYGVPESVRFYQRSVDLYASLEQETGRNVMHSTKGLLWIAHSEAGVRQERARAEVNTAFGAKTEFVGPERIKEICPELDMTGQGVWPIYGASYHAAGASARHDRVVWALAEGAMRRGVHIHQHTAVTGFTRDGDRVTGVERHADTSPRARCSLPSVATSRPFHRCLVFGCRFAHTSCRPSSRIATRAPSIRSWRRRASASTPRRRRRARC